MGFELLPIGAASMWAQRILETFRGPSFEIAINLSIGDQAEVVTALHRKGCAVERIAGRGLYRVTRNQVQA